MREDLSEGWQKPITYKMDTWGPHKDTNAALGAQQGFEDFSDHKRDKQRGQRMIPRGKGGGTVTDVPTTGTVCFALDFTEEVEAGGSAEAE